FIENGLCKPWVDQYNTIIDSLCKDRRVDHALQLFNDMIQKGVNADVITYSSLIHGLCNFGKDRHGGEKYPSQFTYIYHIGKFFLRARFSKRCRAIVIQAMVRKGLHPDVVTYSALIDRYCLRGELSEAHKVLHRMVKRGMKPNIITYSSLINGYCKNKKVNEALNLFRDIQNKGLIPDVFTYNSMMQDIFTYGILSNGMCNNSQMEEDGSLPSSGTYNAIVRELLKKNERQEAENFLDEMINRDFVLDYSIFSMLLPLMPNVGQDSRLRSIIQKLKDVEKKHVGIRDIISRIIS
ncbi:putative tetratricopeptide-like helical domain-containing protein, partial [Tanacetum coccineum]